MIFFSEVEQTGASSQFYDKFSAYDIFESMGRI
jgi:hypothetical protein